MAEPAQAHVQGPLGGKETDKNPTDRAKRGVKRNQLVEARGIPVGPAVDRAHGPNMKLVRETLESLLVGRPEPTADKPPSSPSARSLL